MAPRDRTQEVKEEPGSIGIFAGHWNVKGLLKKSRCLKLRNLILLAHWNHSFDTYLSHWSSLVAQMVKNLPAMQETQVWSLSWEDPLEKGMATHFSFLSGRIPWTDRGAWQATVHGVAKSRTWLSDWSDLIWSDRQPQKFLLEYPEKGIIFPLHLLNH